MKDKDEDKLNSVFDDQSLNETLKRAKRTTLLRTILISSIICILIFFCAYKLNTWWIYKKGREAITVVNLQDSIMKAPNTKIDTETIDVGLFKGTIKRKVSKIVEDKVIPWGTQEMHLDLRGYSSTTFSSHSTKIDETTHLRFPSGEREMLFYVPQFTYNQYADDLSTLKEYPNDKYIELGVSFNEGYTLKQVKDMIPKSARQTWYWANTYSSKAQKRNEPESGTWLFGISDPSSKVGRALSKPKVRSEADFLSRLKQFNPYEYRKMKKRQQDGLIIGVVLTGTKKDLLSLRGQPYVKATSVGAVVDKY